MKKGVEVRLVGQEEDSALDSVLAEARSSHEKTAAVDAFNNHLLQRCAPRLSSWLWQLACSQAAGLQPSSWLWQL